MGTTQEDEWGFADTRTWRRCILQTVRVPAEPFLSIGFADSEYVMRACVGGILNYHAPFTSITTSLIRQWDVRIRTVLREKTGVKQGVRVGMLYDNTGKGLSWFSARGCIREVVVTEGWIALTSDSLEGGMLRQQWRQANKMKGTLFSPLSHPQISHHDKMKWHSCIRMMEDSLVDMGWSVVTDKPMWGNDEGTSRPWQDGGQSYVTKTCPDVCGTR